jgi:hypothetical protein
MVDSQRRGLEGRLRLEVEEAQADLERVMREADRNDPKRRQAAEKLHRAVVRLTDLILRDIVPDDLKM